MKRTTLAAASLLAVTLAGSLRGQQPLSARARPADGTIATGRVVDVLFDPIPAAIVRVLVGDRTLARTSTDGEGVYRVTLPAGGGDLQIEAPGKARRILRWRGPTTAAVRHAVLHDADRLSGRLVDAQQRVAANATVVVVHGDDSQRTTTDAQGLFTFDAVPLQRVLVRAFDERSFTERTVRLPIDDRCELQLQADWAGLRTVRVEGLPAGAAAVHGAIVRVISPDMALLPNGGRHPLDADGTARLLLDAWAIVDVLAPGYETEPQQQLATGGGPPLAFLAKPCEPGAGLRRLTGRLRTTRNGVIRHRRLVVRDRSNRDLGTTIVDAQGDFRVEVELPPERLCRIGLPLEDWALAENDTVLRDGCSWASVFDTSQPIQLWAQPIGRLRCPVRCADGTLLALANVVVQDPENGHRALVETATDQAGNVALSLPDDRYELLAWTHDGRVCTARVDLEPASDLADLEWRTVATGSVAGTLVDGAGTPLPNVQLFLASEQIQNENEVRAGERQSVRVWTNRDGRFRCRGLPSGDWTLVALDGVSVPARSLTIEAGRELRLELTGERD